MTGTALRSRGVTAQASPGAGQVLAAGTVCWRRVEIANGAHEVLVLVIHRTKQRDVSFPKGKLDPGESMPEAAVRETLEETGIAVHLGCNLGTIEYALSGDRTKTVQYWSAEVSEEALADSSFTPNKEVQALEWLPIAQVRDRLSYDADRELFDVFLCLADHDLLETFSITLLRHAQAAPLSRMPVDSGEPAVDSDRRLTGAGELQAERIAPMLETFHPRRVYTSTARRCRDTVEPLADRLEKRMRPHESLSQDSWEQGDLSGLRALVAKVVKRGKNVVLCTHLPVLPDFAREIALATGSTHGDYLREATSLPPGGFAVFHMSRRHPESGILGVEIYPVKL